MSTPPQTPLPPPPSIGALLRMAWTELIDEVVRELAAAGYDDLRPVHAPILRDLLTEGLRPTDLAARLGLSKQAVNDLLREVEQMGYITLVPDPEDGRAKRIAATEKGWRLGAEATRLATRVGERWARQVGAERYAVFEDVLREIVEGDATRRGREGGGQDR